MKLKLLSVLFIITISLSVSAGNPDRIGSASGTQLLINSWARSSGMGWSYMSMVKGVEAMYMNVGGITRQPGVEFNYTRTNWLVGTDIFVNSFGGTVQLGEDHFIGVSVMAMDLGDIEITTTQQPDGGLGTYSPSINNVGFAYAKKFTDQIRAGIVLKGISEAISNVRAQGVALDFGIQYVNTFNRYNKSGKKSIKQNDFHFGISLKNIGPALRFQGDGLVDRVKPEETDEQFSLALRTAAAGLPTVLNMGVSYDIRLDKSEETYNHRLTPSFAFTSNAYAQNQTTVGVEYGYKELLMLRAGYAYEEGIFEYDTRTNVFTGPSAGFSVDLPFGENNLKKFGVDYSYRHTNPFSGVHSFGFKVSF